MQTMNFKKLLGVTLLALSLGCKNDIDINASYKDVAVVYGFLDQNESINYIRIEKLYQNSGSLSTAEGAQHADSLYFDSLYVTLKNINTNVVYNCYQVDTIAKDSGFFSNAKHVMYAVKIPKNNNANESYRIDILYPKKNAAYSSLTNIVKDAYIPVRKIALKLVPANHVFPFKFTTGKNAYLYDLTVRYWYKEMNASDTNIYVMKYLDYEVSKSIPYNPESEYTKLIGSTYFINYLKERIPYDNSKVRRTSGIDYIAYGGSSAFQTMLDLSQPNLTVVQKNPQYSNVVNGLGIFTSRNYMKQTMELDPTSVELLANELPNFIN